MSEPSLQSEDDANNDRPDLGAGPGIPELVPALIEACEYRLDGSRLNLVIPVISRKWMYGGVATALRFFEKLSAEFAYVRVVVLYEVEEKFDFDEWPGWSADSNHGATHTIAFLGDRKTSLYVGAEDLFLATLWSTAVYIKHVRAFQAKRYPQSLGRFVYLIQDFEPSFYPWSAQYVYAKETYLDREDVIAVFNTQFLADYFCSAGFRFPERYVFEPMLNTRLQKNRSEARGVEKERLILVYARTAHPRNGFDLVVEALRIWAKTFPDAGEWTLVSAGERHVDVCVSREVTLRSKGKLTLDEYAWYLSRCWVGLSLMFSPHPSYPPLEMAEFGAWTITNAFENKNLSLLAPNILSVDRLTPEAIAAKLEWSCQQYQSGRTMEFLDSPRLLKGEVDEFPFTHALAQSWRRDRSVEQP
jgi:hypothetical protein